MPISHKYKVIFIHIPKNAGTSIVEALEMDDEGHHKFDYYQNKYPNEWENYKKIAVIRNPLDRTVSNYEYSRLDESYWHSFTNKTPYGPHPDYNLLKNVDFAGCVNLLYEDRSLFKHHGWDSQYPYVINSKQEIIVDHLIDYENINEELKNLFNIELKKINQSNHKEYKDYYNEDLLEKVHQIYKKDLKIFNFKIN